MALSWLTKAGAIGGLLIGLGAAIPGVREIFDTSINLANSGTLTTITETADDVRGKLDAVTGGTVRGSIANFILGAAVPVVGGILGGAVVGAGINLVRMGLKSIFAKKAA